MSKIEPVITRINHKLRSLHQEQSLAAKVNNDNSLVDPLLYEYLKFTDSEAVILAVRYIILDALANHFNLYQDDRDRQQILSAIGEEFSTTDDKDILVSLQIIQSTYPALYHISKEQIDLTQERAISHITKIPIATSSGIQSITSTADILTDRVIEAEIFTTTTNTGFFDEVKVSILETDRNNKYSNIKNIAKRITIAIGFTIRTILITIIVITWGLVEGFFRGLMNMK